MKKVLLFAFALLTFSALSAQELNPVKWTYQAEKLADGEYNLVFVPHITDGWYIYSQTIGENGPIPTRFHFNENAKVKFAGIVAEAGAKHEGYDEIFEMNLVKFSGQPKFTQRVKLTAGTTLTGYVEFMTCDKTRCLPPTEVEFTFKLQ